MCQMTASFTRTCSYGLAVLLLAIAIPATPSVAAAQPDYSYLEGRGIADGSESDNINDALSAEPLVENGWDFEKPESIPGFGALPPAEAVDQ